MDDEELEAVRSVYCGEDEFTIISNDKSSTVFTVRLPTSDTHNVRISATFSVSPHAWDVLIQDALFSRNSLTRMKSAFNAWRSSEHTVWDAFTWITENGASFLDIPGASTSSDIQEDTTCYAVVIQLNHVRDVKRYSKVLQSACEDFGLVAKMLFRTQGGPLLVGRSKSQEEIKEFLKALKSRNVDVDSKGMPCKERMCSVLYRGSAKVDASDTAGTTFAVAYCKSSEDVESEFKTMLLGHLFSECVRQKVF